MINVEYSIIKITHREGAIHWRSVMRQFGNWWAVEPIHNSKHIMNRRPLIKHQRDARQHQFRKHNDGFASGEFYGLQSIKIRQLSQINEWWIEKLNL